MNEPLIQSLIRDNAQVAKHCNIATSAVLHLPTALEKVGRSFKAFSTLTDVGEKKRNEEVPAAYS